MVLAAIGAAIVFAPESIKFLENKRSLRFLMAGFCVLAGIAGLVSGHTQRGENDRRQSELTTQIASLQQQAERTERNTEHPPMINVPPSVINIPAPKNNFDPLKERTLVLRYGWRHRGGKKAKIRTEKSISSGNY